MLRLLCSGIALLLVSGCASYGVVENAPAQNAGDEQSYSIKSFMKGWRSKENALILAFSGGGTRAAALSYGVLKELRDTPVVFEGKTKPLLDQEYFNLLCSDLSSYPVARAVTASSAVPVVFNPVVVENYPECGSELPDWLKAARSRAIDSPEMDRSRKQPSLKETINAMSDLQLHHYNVATIELMKRSMDRWARELSTPDRPVTPYIILLDFSGIQGPERRRFFNQTPTSFKLTDEQVDRLIEAGGELLRNDPEFPRLLSDLEADRHRNQRSGAAANSGSSSTRQLL